MINQNREIIDFYNSYSENQRLNGKSIEKIRTQELISRHLLPGSRTILDIGGGTGVYSFWLSDQGHNVYLVDASAKHIQQAQEHMNATGVKLQMISIGDARKLDFEDEKFDNVLMLGPLYHLTKEEDRITALLEAKRVLKPGGIIFAAAISRYASMFDGFQYDLIQDPDFISIMKQDLLNGQHRNIEGKNYFTTSFFHLPGELEAEIRTAGFDSIFTYAVESFAETIPNLTEKMLNEAFRNVLIETIRKIEQDKVIMGISPHFIGIGKKL
jgi:ubiquinone/menaquinone biosynthesis C-methylase UbiE